jgi:hypothetical protein
MPSLANLMEDYRNWRGRQDWEQGKGWQDFFGGDSEMQERAERFGGFGTGSHGIGGLAGMIKASHGSPHLFDKFDFTKIGSGEGNQSYGHGGYFAQGFDSPVAQSYISAGQATRAPDRTTEMVARALDASGGIESKAKEWLANRIKTSPSDFHDLYKDAINRFDEVKPQGTLYNVELKWPDAAREASDPLSEHHLLDYDVALGSQPTHVLKAIKNIPESKLYDLGINPDLSDAYTKEPILGKDFLGYVSNQLGKKQGSNYLNSFGIPGIRYLDQASRNAGYGTHNYVMFDDQFPDIVSRNGVSLSDLLRR